MEAPRVFESEYRFLLIVWANEPVPSGELVRLAAEQLTWKKSTTYTVIRRLCERGVLRSEGGIVRALFTQEEVQRQVGSAFLQSTFGGSLPSLVAAFARARTLSPEEAAEIRRIIDEYGEGRP